ncbi:MAG: hypothetical protein NWF00_13140 [Candidatus Bathyarchaeota archaeon]|nr:hypothetical protein [Candidatus Bathyarchaeota archaeon]
MSGKTVGRKKLAEQIDVGEGAVRTILSRLVEAGLMTASKMGCGLSVEGLSVWRKFEVLFPKRVSFPPSELSGCAFNFAFLVRGCGDRVESGIEQRDVAVVAGASCAVVVVFQGGRLHIESVSEDVKKTFPEAANQIFEEFKPQNGDVIVIAGGDTELKAKHGAFAASWFLLGDEVDEALQKSAKQQPVPQ